LLTKVYKAYFKLIAALLEQFIKFKPAGSTQHTTDDW